MPKTRINISKLSSAEAVLQAVAECDAIGRDEFLRKYGFGPARTFSLIHEGNAYDSKAIAGVAYGYQHGVFPSAENFSGGHATVARALGKLGFAVESASHPVTWLVKGRVYQRKELVDRYGGQLQAGIWTPKDFRVLFLFTGGAGAKYGYEDRWTAAGTYEYAGEGQIGDMTFEAGNLEVLEHRERGKDLFLFRDQGKGKGVRYEGLFECVGCAVRRGPDREGTTRDIIVFELAPVSSAEEGPAVATLKNIPLGQLRAAAYRAAEKVKQAGVKGTTTRGWYERAEDVRAYVLARAGGLCECCGKAAPFTSKAGNPYLEPHHTTRRADSGLDHPAHVAGICPDCHRHVHFGVDGVELNEKLKCIVQAKEADGGELPLINVLDVQNARNPSL